MLDFFEILAREPEHALYMTMFDNFLVEINRFVYELSFLCDAFKFELKGVQGVFELLATIDRV